MGLRRSLARLIEGKKGNKRKAANVESPEDIARQVSQRVDLVERITALKATGADVTAEVRRTGGGVNLAWVNFPLQEYEPRAFKAAVGERLGEGRVELRFRKADNDLFRKTDTGAIETLSFDVEGPPRKQPPAQKTDSRSSQERDLFMKYIMEQQAQLMKIIMEGRGDQVDATAVANQMLDGALKLNQMAQGPAQESMAKQMSEMMALQVQFNNSMSAARPQVQATGATGGMWSEIGKGIGAVVSPLVGAGIDRVMQANPQQDAFPSSQPFPPLEQGTQDNIVKPESPDNIVHMQPQEREAQSAFGGIQSGPSPAAGEGIEPSGVPGAFDPTLVATTPLDQLADEAGPVIGANGALQFLRFLLIQDIDPQVQVGQFWDAFNLLNGARLIDGAWENFVTPENAGEMFDQFAAQIPELAQNPELTARLRPEAIGQIEELYEPGEEEAVDESADEFSVSTELQGENDTTTDNDG